MKALILEDSFQKLSTASRILHEYSMEYVHFDNTDAPYQMYLVNGSLADFDLVILDLFFYKRVPLIGETRLPSSTAGFYFLLKMAEYEYSVPVIIYSSEDSYLSGLENFFLPTLEEYSKSFEKAPLPSRCYNVEERYKNEIENKKKFLEFAKNLILGHAHDAFELKRLVSEFTISKR